jgi:hypothetical protein
MGGQHRQPYGIGDAEAAGLASGIGDMAGEADIAGEASTAEGDIAAVGSGDIMGEGVARGAIAGELGTVASGEGPELTGVLSALTSFFSHANRSAAERMGRTILSGWRGLVLAVMDDITSRLRPRASRKIRRGRKSRRQVIIY